MSDDQSKLNLIKAIKHLQELSASKPDEDLFFAISHRDHGNNLLCQLDRLREEAKLNFDQQITLIKLIQQIQKDVAAEYKESKND